MIELYLIMQNSYIPPFFILIDCFIPRKKIWM